MSTQLLIYERAVAVNNQKHKDCSVKTGSNYDFAKNINSVPLTAIEFTNATPEYSIVFAGSEDAVMPAVILGFRDNENLYLADDGKWNSQYIPAFIRRYPFIFSSSDDGKQLSLCIDEEFTGLNKNGVGERLFDSEGEKTQYLQRVLNFSSEYQGQFQRTQTFSKKLKELNLLEPMHAQITLATGKKMDLGGFQVVSRERLNKLTNKQIGSLVKSGELELIYLHLQSLRNFNTMVDRVTANETNGSGDKVEAEEKNNSEESLH